MRELAADTFDLINREAEVNGGIGRGSFLDFDGKPLCAHALVGRRDFYEIYSDEIGHHISQLYAADISMTDSDSAVANVLRRTERWGDERVSFSDWCVELEIVRAPAEIAA